MILAKMSLLAWPGQRGGGRQPPMACGVRDKLFEVSGMHAYM